VTVNPPAEGIAEFIRQVGGAMVRWFCWLLVATFIGKAPWWAQAVLLPAWFVVFFWRYVQPGPPNPQSAALQFVRSRRIVVTIALLTLTVFLSIPWWVSFFTFACARQNSFDAVWASRITADAGAPLALSAFLSFLRVATYPLVEEFTFRGWLLAPLRKKWGTHIAVIATSLVFALIHVSPLFLVRNFIFGILYGYAVVMTGSLWSSVAMHFTFNMVSEFLPTTPLHPLLKSAFNTAVFRCRPSGLMVLLTVLVIFELLHRERKIHMSQRASNRGG
jgi:membrane protease YdiL (CAAX protease family)